MQVIFGDDVSTVSHQATKRKDSDLGRAGLCDQEQSRLCVTAPNKCQMGKVDDLIKNNQQVTQREIAVKLGISQQHMDHIIDVLQYWRVYAKWVLCMLTAEMKASRMEFFQQLSCYRSNSEMLSFIVSHQPTKYGLIILRQK